MRRQRIEDDFNVFNCGEMDYVAGIILNPPRDEPRWPVHFEGQAIGHIDPLSPVGNLIRNKCDRVRRGYNNGEKIANSLL